MPREYVTVAIDPEDIEEGIKDARLLSLRKGGYRAVAVLPVEHKGRPRLAFVMEPPTGEETAMEVREPPVPTVPTVPPAPMPRAFWVWVGLSVLGTMTGLVSVLLQLLR